MNPPPNPGQVPLFYSNLASSPAPALPKTEAESESTGTESFPLFSQQSEEQPPTPTPEVRTQPHEPFYAASSQGTSETNPPLSASLGFQDALQSITDGPLDGDDGIEMRAHESEVNIGFLDETAQAAHNESVPEVSVKMVDTPIEFIEEKHDNSEQSTSMDSCTAAWSVDGVSQRSIDVQSETETTSQSNVMPEIDSVSPLLPGSLSVPVVDTTPAMSHDEPMALHDSAEISVVEIFKSSDREATSESQLQPTISDQQSENVLEENAPLPSLCRVDDAAPQGIEPSVVVYEQSSDPQGSDNSPHDIAYQAPAISDDSNALAADCVSPVARVSSTTDPETSVGEVMYVEETLARLSASESLENTTEEQTEPNVSTSPEASLPIEREPSPEREVTQQGDTTSVTDHVENEPELVTSPIKSEHSSDASLDMASASSHATAVAAQVQAEPEQRPIKLSEEDIPAPAEQTDVFRRVTRGRDITLRPDNSSVYAAIKKAGKGKEKQSKPAARGRTTSTATKVSKAKIMKPSTRKAVEKKAMPPKKSAVPKGGKSSKATKKAPVVKPAKKPQKRAQSSNKATPPKRAKK